VAPGLQYYRSLLFSPLRAAFLASLVYRDCGAPYLQKNSGKNDTFENVQKEYLESYDELVKNLM